MLFEFVWILFNIELNVNKVYYSGKVFKIYFSKKFCI